MYVQPRSVRLEDCDFYHSIDLPGVGFVAGDWDLRGRIDEYLGHANFGGKRVLEIGPASGFLTVEMERRGADVVAVDIPPDAQELVPYSPDIVDPIREPRRIHNARSRNSFWFVRQAAGSKAQVYYGDASRLPTELGSFDIAVLASVLLHTRSPLSILEQCAKIARSIVIVERYEAEIEGAPVCRLVPTRDNKVVETWWQFSTAFFVQFLEVMGFAQLAVTRHKQQSRFGEMAMFTIVATR